MKDILEKVKNFQPIEEQLYKLKSGQPLNTIDIDDAGTVEVLVVSASPEKWVNIKPDSKKPRWQILVGGKGYFVEEHVASILSIIGFTKELHLLGCCNLFHGSMNLFASAAKRETHRNKVERLFKKGFDFDVWSAENGYLQQRFDEAKDWVLRKSPAPNDDLKYFLEICSDDKLKKFLRLAGGYPDLSLYNAEQKGSYCAKLNLPTIIYSRIKFTL